MTWKQAMRRPVLGPKATELVQEFLRRAIPPFVAPTNPRAWAVEVRRLRREALAKVYLRGYPAAIVHARPRVVWTGVLRPEPGYRIRKLRYEIYPNYWIPAALYEPARPTGKVPVVLNPHGHHAGGKGHVDYQIRCANLALRGALALSLEFIGMGELQADRLHNQQAHLNLTGLAGVGLFYLALQKGLDVLLAHPHADPQRVACTGLSGGGWQTIVSAALDPRVKLAVPVAGYTSMRARVDHPEDRGDLEQAPPDLTTVLDYQTMTAMLAPRPALLILNEHDDCCFRTAHTRAVIYEAIQPVYRAHGAADRFKFYSNHEPGTHNYGEDNRHQFYWFLSRQFGLPGPEHDLHTPAAVLPEPALEAGLPDNQETMLSLALARAKQLARRRQIPRTPTARARLRRAIAAVIKLPRYAVRARRLQGDAQLGVYALRVGPWTIPVAGAIRRGGEADLMIEDTGRAGRATQPPAPGRSVLVAEILGTGENKIASPLLTMIEAAGHRVLGIEVAQILACAAWARRATGARRLHLHGNGTFSAFAALVAAALQPRLFCKLSISWEVNRLAYLIQWPYTYEEALPLFCFGFLEVADVPELKALLDGVEYHAWGRGSPPEPPPPR